VGHTEQLRRDAREIFRRALEAADARRAVLDAVRVEGTRLRVCGAEFEFGPSGGRVYSVALGKAGAEMAAALDERLGPRLARGVVSAPATSHGLPSRWLVYAGGHPLPNGESFEAARTALGLLRAADAEAAGEACEAVLVVFLVSGGGSAMLELPRDPRVTLEELREANRALVSCGASISEINAVRRALSAVKGGGLAAAAGRAAQVTLLVSDTNRGRERDVASGPTLEPDADAPDPREVLARHGLRATLPGSVLRALEEVDEAGAVGQHHAAAPRREHFVLLDNGTACDAAARAARRLGYSTQVAADLVEQHVEAGTAEMVSRLVSLAGPGWGEGRGGPRRSEDDRRGVCLVSGGEFSCPVRGGGLGGRSAETALRCAFEFRKAARASGGGQEVGHGDDAETTGGGAAASLGDGSGHDADGGAGHDAEAAREGSAAAREFVTLCAGTDGADGNSPAAGALADHTTLDRARARGLDPERHLAESDAYALFEALGDAVVTGPTGTNVRDLRLLLAR